MKTQKIVQEIMEAVRKEGDRAVRRYTLKFDKMRLRSFEVTPKEIREAYKRIDPEVLAALRKAKANIASFARLQKAQYQNFEETRGGVTYGQRVVPIERVGVYIPGGRYPLPSTSLMCIVPAKLAGVSEIIACSPKASLETIVAADLAGADRIFRIGGIQAIAAMAYGTKQVPRADKIVGPGNAYVAAAKQYAAGLGLCGIDLPAGPSEVFIIADAKANPAYIAADLLAQLEHDPDAKATLVSPSQKLLDAARQSLEAQMKNLTTRDIIRLSLGKSVWKRVRSLDAAVEYANEIAPEHLEIQVENPDALIPQLTSYGSLFIGGEAAEVFGDYCSGPNHVLPTGGAARFTGGLSVGSYLKLLTYQKLTPEGVRKLAPVAATLARAEGLDAHRNAAEIRMK